MRFFFICLLLCCGSFLPAAQAQQPAPRYEFMHLNYTGTRIYFSPAHQGKDLVKVKEYMGRDFTLFDEEKLGWKAMSRLLNELSGAGWELVSVMPDNGKDGNEGAIYLLRKPQP